MFGLVSSIGLVVSTAAAALSSCASYDELHMLVEAVVCGVSVVDSMLGLLLPSTLSATAETSAEIWELVATSSFVCVAIVVGAVAGAGTAGVSAVAGVAVTVGV
jgi:hypothetical protein